MLGSSGEGQVGQLASRNATAGDQLVEIAEDDEGTKTCTHVASNAANVDGCVVVELSRSHDAGDKKWTARQKKT